MRNRKAEWAAKTPEQHAAHAEAVRQGALKRYKDPAERARLKVQMQSQLADPEKRERLNAGHRTAMAARAAAPGFRPTRQPEYKLWDAMVQRCTNANTIGFARYGGRGITVFTDWLGVGGFTRFFEHIGARPTPKHTLGRIDNDKGYVPGNVRWETRLEQMRNWSRNRMVTINGETHHLTEWARRIGCTPPALTYRLKQGWAPEDLLKPGRAGS